MRRITADEIVKAYQETGVRPAIHDYARFDEHGVICACGLAALYLYEVRDRVDVREEVRQIEQMSDGNTGPDDLIAEELILDYDYMNGFMSGFDGGWIRDTTSPVTRFGYEDGLAARRRVLGWDIDDHGEEVMTVLI